MGRLGGKGTFLSELIWFHAEATEKLMQHYRRSLHFTHADMVQRQHELLEYTHHDTP